MPKHYVGVDIGGTNLRFGVVDENGNLKDEDFKSFNDEYKSINGTQIHLDYIVRDLRCFLKKNIKYNILKIGIGIAGQIDEERGDVLFSPNLNWRNVPLKTILESETGLGVKVVNDLTAITYGEWKRGAGRGENNIVCVFVGTGIGSGVIIDGNMVTGCSGAAGEIGHTVIVSGGRKCTCGNNGCLEAYAGGRGIADIAKEKALKDESGFKKITELAGGINNITAETVAKAYYSGDEHAVMLVKDTGIYLSDGLVTAVNLINPCLLILGGGILEGIPDLFDIAVREIYKRALRASTSHLKIVKPILGKSVGIIGSAGLASASI